MGCGEGQLSAVPQAGHLGSGCQGKVLGSQQPPSLFPSGKTPAVLAPGLEQRFWSGRFGTSRALLWVLAALSPAQAKGECWEPDLGSTAASRTRAAHGGEGEQTPTNPPLPALQELPEPAASAGSLGRAGPARCASTAGERPCPRLSAHILTPELGCWSRLSLFCTSLAWGWLLSAWRLLGWV